MRGSSVAPLQQPKGGNGALTLQPGGAPGQAFKVQSAGGPGQFT